MPLTAQDRRFLHAVARLKLYTLLMGIAMFAYVVGLPPSSLQLPILIFGLALCGVFWLTHRLLACITLLDLELTRLLNAVKGQLRDPSVPPR